MEFVLVIAFWVLVLAALGGVTFRFIRRKN
jgi:hypothetical protein